MATIEPITAELFEQEVSACPLPVLIDFHAEWCGPCKGAAPMLADIAREYDGEAKVVKIDVDQEQALARRFAVKSLPTLILLHDGETTPYNGSLTRGGVSAFLDRHLAGDA